MWWFIPCTPTQCSLMGSPALTTICEGSKVNARMRHLPSAAGLLRTRPPPSGIGAVGNASGLWWASPLVVVLPSMLSDDDPLLRTALRDVTSVPEGQVIAKP